MEIAAIDGALPGKKGRRQESLIISVLTNKPLASVGGSGRLGWAEERGGVTGCDSSGRLRCHRIGPHRLRLRGFRAPPAGPKKRRQPDTGLATSERTPPPPNPAPYYLMASRKLRLCCFTLPNSVSVSLFRIVFLKLRLGNEIESG